MREDSSWKSWEWFLTSNKIKGKGCRSVRMWETILFQCQSHPVTMNSTNAMTSTLPCSSLRSLRRSHRQRTNWIWVTLRAHPSVQSWKTSSTTTSATQDYRTGVSGAFGDWSRNKGKQARHGFSFRSQLQVRSTFNMRHTPSYMRNNISKIAMPRLELFLTVQLHQIAKYSSRNKIWAFADG